MLQEAFALSEASEVYPAILSAVPVSLVSCRYVPLRDESCKSQGLLAIGSKPQGAAPKGKAAVSRNAYLLCTVRVGFRKDLHIQGAM